MNKNILKAMDALTEQYGIVDTLEAVQEWIEEVYGDSEYIIEFIPEDWPSLH